MFLSTKMVTKFGANAFALPLYKKQVSFSRFFMTKEMKQALSLC